jgi:hypothetical protein
MSAPRNSNYASQRISNSQLSNSSTASTMTRAESEALATSISSILITTHQVTSPNTSPTPSRSNVSNFSPVKGLFSNSYVAYGITVSSLAGETWTVWRRFSNFVELQDTLPEPSQAEIRAAEGWVYESDLSWNYDTNTPTGLPPMPQTPPRPSLPPKGLNTHIPTRRLQLNTYLHLLHLTPSVRSHPTFLSFIGADRLLLNPTHANLTSFPYAFRSTTGLMGGGGSGNKNGSKEGDYFCTLL